MPAPAFETFPQTRWTLIQRVTEGSPAEVQQALEELCRSYWPPLYVVARAKGHSPENAADYVQGFFEHCLKNNMFAKADSGRGRLRSLLRTAFDHFVINQLNRDLARKRGGGKQHVPIDLATAEGHFLSGNDTSTRSPDQLFERAWAMNVLEHALQRLRQEQERFGTPQQCALLEQWLPRGGDDGAQTDAAAEAGMRPDQFRGLVRRYRGRYRELIRDEVKETIHSSNSSEIDAELRHLIAALS